MTMNMGPMGALKPIATRKYVGFVFLTLISMLWIYLPTTRSSSRFPGPGSEHHDSNPSPPLASSTITPLAQHFFDYPLEGPRYGDHFGELGRRVALLTEWVSKLDTHREDYLLREIVEKVSINMFPFLRNPSKPEDVLPLESLRESYISGSVGIVIPVGAKDFRFACHLVLSLRNVLRSTLPIQIAYAGEDDLPSENRRILSILGQDVEFLDITTILDDSVMQVEKSWAIKPFAVLASTFEQVILIDADAVFLQRPETLILQRGYQEAGALLFHDRLLWQHGFQERHEWWRKQMKYRVPSKALNKSLVWTEDYAEEEDSGVVVLNKSKLPVFMGLLHICWQNTKSVREETTYKITYGDKESWWFGLELCGAPYAFENHYGAVLGDIIQRNSRQDVCGFTIAHVDENEKLAWYNGSLLKNKAIDKKTFMVPSHWMIDAEWEKGATKADWSCMKRGNAIVLTTDEAAILQKCVDVAKKFDLGHPFGG